MAQVPCKCRVWAINTPPTYFLVCLPLREHETRSQFPSGPSAPPFIQNIWFTFQSSTLHLLFQEAFPDAHGWVKCPPYDPEYLLYHSLQHTRIILLVPPPSVTNPASLTSLLPLWILAVKP